MRKTLSPIAAGFAVAAVEGPSGRNAGLRGNFGCASSGAVHPELKGFGSPRRERFQLVRLELLSELVETLGGVQDFAAE